MSGGGKGGGDVVVGYRYYMGMHVALCHGPVDSINTIIVGEREAWSGSVTTNQTIYIDKYNLFGGEKREGGVRGYVDVLLGAEDQGQNAYLSDVVNTGESSVDVPTFSTILMAMMTNPTTGVTTTYPDGRLYTFKLIITPEPDGDTNYTVTKRITYTNGSYEEGQLISTTYPGNANAEADANAVFLRTSQTTVSTDGLTGVTTYVTNVEVGDIPGFRGITSLVFKKFMWSMINPYFKPLWIGVSRVLKGWQNDQVWYSAKAKIGTYDMNPAHILYQCMTDRTWGMGESRDDFNDTQWRAAADQLYSEGFGLSLRWMQQTSIKEFIQVICDHINGAVRLNMLTGLFELVLFRDNYTLANLIELNVDNVQGISSFQRAAYGELCGEVVVQYTSRDEQTATLAVQDGAAIAAQGGVISTTREYPGIRDDGLALRVAMRDLRVLSSPLAKVSLKCNRVLWQHDKGDLFRLTWAPLGLTDIPFRITDINKGSLTNGWIEVEAVEDVFGLPDNAYASAQPPVWVDPTQAPHAIQYGRLLESPYWDVIRNTPAADFGYLPSDFAFVQHYARYGSGYSPSYELWSAPSNTTSAFVNTGTKHYSPHGFLAMPLTRTSTTAYFTGQTGMDSSVVGKYAYIGDECVAIDAIDTTLGKMTIRRGVLDTVPVTHAQSETIWINTLSGVDTTTHEAAETVYYRPVPTSSLGTMAVADVASTSILLKGRAQLPFPPGQVKVNASYYPTNVVGAFTITWAHRDRTQQTVSLNDYTYGNIGPETGVTYTLKIMKADGTVLRTLTGLTGTSYSYPIADDIADGVQGTLRFQLWSVRSTLTSWQTHDHTVTRYGLGLQLGKSLGTLV